MNCAGPLLFCFPFFALHAVDMKFPPVTQALEQVHRSTTVHLPIYNDAQKAVMQEQLTLLAEIAQGACGYNS
jgi:hypothetical protein